MLDFSIHPKSSKRVSNFEAFKDVMHDINQMDIKEKTSSRKLKRNISSNVCSRWYRSPEVILQEDYDQAMDLWSIGCVLGELIYCSEPYVN
jgi:serine/threonine protein kinase